MLNLKSLLIPAVLLLAVGCSSKPKEAATEATGTSTEAVAETPSAPAGDTAGLPTVIDFSATWCGPCQMIAPAVHELAEQSKDKVNFRFIDIDENRDMAQQYGIEAVPTFIILDATGKEVNRIVGADINGLTDAVNALSK